MPSRPARMFRTRSMESPWAPSKVTLGRDSRDLPVRPIRPSALLTAKGDTSLRLGSGYLVRPRPPLALLIRAEPASEPLHFGLISPCPPAPSSFFGWILARPGFRPHQVKVVLGAVL